VKRLVVVLLVLAVLLVGADRLGAYVAGQVVAAKLRTSAGLAADPSVRITGFPFLTQAIAGRYDRITVDAKDVNRGGAQLSDLTVDLIGARIPARQAISGAVPAVPVEALRGSVTLSYADLVRRHTELVVTPLSGDRARVTGRLTILGQALTASTVSTLSLRGSALVLTAQSVAVEGQSSPLVDRALAGRLDLRVPLGSLPYGLRLMSVHSTADGIVVDASSGPAVLQAR